MKKKLTIVGVLGIAVIGLSGVLAWAIQETKPCSVSNPAALSVSTHYLAAQPGFPVLDFPISVAPDLATLEEMFASVEDRQRYDQIVAEGGVLLVPGGAPVSVLTIQGDYVQVRLQLCDIQGNDITGRTGWTHQLFLQTIQAETL